MHGKVAEANKSKSLQVIARGRIVDAGRAVVSATKRAAVGALINFQEEGVVQSLYMVCIGSAPLAADGHGAGVPRIAARALAVAHCWAPMRMDNDLSQEAVN